MDWIGLRARPVLHADVAIVWLIEIVEVFVVHRRGLNISINGIAAGLRNTG